MTKPTTFSRRRVLAWGASAMVAGATRRKAFAQDSAVGANRRIRIGVMGLNRGLAHIDNYLRIKDVEVAYVCDVDSRRLAAGAERVSKTQKTRVAAVADVRSMLDDPTVDAISIAAPNFWHAPAAILACQAGKHVYVEKPGSHNAHESLQLVATAKRHKRHVQQGVQRRSMPLYIEAVQRLRDGDIGRLRYARCWYDSARGSIGRGQTTDVPNWLNYDLWQGPIPHRPYKDNLVHYKWHWRWHWGNGELGNNGVHALDIARWGMNVDVPIRVSYTGGRYHFDDDQETPDTGVAAFGFPEVGITWDGSSCHRRKHEHHSFVTFYGDAGSLAVNDRGYTVYDAEGKEVAAEQPPNLHIAHFINFIDAVRDDVRLNAEIAEAQKAALLCHYGNIAYRLGQTLHIDPTTRRVTNDVDLGSLWQREYRSGWEV